MKNRFFNDIYKNFDDFRFFIDLGWRGLFEGYLPLSSLSKLSYKAKKIGRSSEVKTNIVKTVDSTSRNIR